MTKNNLKDFVLFLKKYHKKNGDKILSSTIELYTFYLNKYIKDLEMLKKDEDSLLEFMNNILEKQSSNTLFSVFRKYLLYIGFEDTSKVYVKLKKPIRRANFVSSQRFLQSKLLSIQEVKRLLIETKELKNRVIISFLFDTACRRSELLNIKWRDILFYKEPNNNIYGEVSVLGKGKKSRKVFFGRTTYRLLTKWKEETLHGSEDDFLIRFYHDREEKKLYKYQSDALYKLIKHLGISILGREIHPHMFRHSKSQQLANDGADMLGISSYLGHSNITTTQVYVKNSGVIGKKAFSEHSRDVLDGNK